MPAVDKRSKVLVTGANGYIAMWIVRTLLERGFKARGTVRTKEKGEYMVEYFKSLGYGDDFEYVIVDDIVKEGAFDEAVKGVDAIEHTVSPFHFNPKEPEDLIVPAVQGTLGILKSALKNGSQVKRIVMTSSCAAVITVPQTKPGVYTEEDWNSSSVKEVEEKGNKSPPAIAYYASKTLAERAAWDFCEQHKAEIKWDFTAIIPAMTFGPAIHEATSLSSMGAALEAWYGIVVADSPKPRETLFESQGWVEVRDCALGHVLALEKEAAGGQRIFTVAGCFQWQEFVDAASSVLSAQGSSRKIYSGFPDITQGEPVYMFTYDNAKQNSILGIKYRSKLEATKDILEYFSERGM